MNKMEAFAEWIDEKLYYPCLREEYSEEDIKQLQHTERDTNILLAIGLIIYIPIAFLVKLVSLNK